MSSRTSKSPQKTPHWNGKISNFPVRILLMTRRTLLQAGTGAVGAVSIIGLSPRSSKAAKVSQAAVAYQSSPKGDKNCANCRLIESPYARKQVEGVISPQCLVQDLNRRRASA